MNYTIKNQDLIIEISDHGAELKKASFKKTDYLHDSNPKSWNRSAPILFPNVGAIKDNFATFDNVQYKMLKHGFLRDRDFVVTNQEASAITLSYSSTPADLKIYPFSFKLEITYQIHGNTLKSYIVITNQSSKEMPFNLGLHPAFKVPLFEDEKFEDYKIIFDQSINALCPTINLQEGTIDFENHSRTFNDLRELPLNYDDYKNDALVFLNNSSRYVKLLNKDNTHGIAFEFNDFPMLGIWTPNHTKANFICLEPWIGCADAENHNHVFEDKPNIVKLNESESKLFTYQIKFF